MQHLLNVRIEKAKKLLMTKRYGIAEIAKMVGFSSIHYFSRYFKEKEGVTPVEYREKRQNSVAPPVYR